LPERSAFSRTNNSVIGSAGWVNGPPGAYKSPAGPWTSPLVPYGWRGSCASDTGTKSVFTGDREDREDFRCEDRRSPQDMFDTIVDQRDQLC
jgi:hypothetical protein